MRYYLNKKRCWENQTKNIDFCNCTELVDKYFNSKPHALLHIGYLSIIFNAEGLSGKRVLSVGVDICKDVMLARLNNVQMVVIDNCEELVAGLKDCKVGQGCKYIKLDVTNGKDFTDLITGWKIDVLLLSQMDALLNDDEIKNIVENAYYAGIKHIVVLSPSLYSILTCCNPLVFVRNVLDLCIDFVAFILTIRYVKNGYFERCRLFYTFNKFFKKYKLLKKIIYFYPSGRCHLLHYERA